MLQQNFNFTIIYPADILEGVFIMNKCFDKRFYKRERTIKKNLVFEVKLYDKLVEYSKYYDATITDLVNAAIDNYLNSGEVKFYERAPNELLEKHPMNIRESNLAGIEALKDKYSINMYKLVNDAIKYTLED